MGSYPGARLQYGIDLGDELEYDIDDVDEVIGRDFPGLSLNYTGDLYRGYTRYILAGPCVTVDAYESPTVTVETLAIPEGVTERLKAAYRMIDASGEIPEPRWMITVHYG